MVKTDDGACSKFTPTNDVRMSISEFPHLIIEVHSEKKEGDRYRLMLEAFCLARLGNRLQDHKSEPFIVMAIYVDAHFRASQYLFFQPDESTHKVLWPDLPDRLWLMGHLSRSNTFTIILIWVRLKELSSSSFSCTTISPKHALKIRISITLQVG